MPCYDHRDSPSTLNAEIAKNEEEMAVLKKRINALTDLLCQVGRSLYGRKPIPAKAVVWWDFHRKWDSDRGEPWEEK